MERQGIDSATPASAADSPLRAIFRRAAAFCKDATLEDRENDEFEARQESLETSLRDLIGDVLPEATTFDRDEAVRLAWRSVRQPCEEYDLVGVLQRVARRQIAREARRAARPANVRSQSALRHALQRVRSRERRASRPAATRSSPASEDGPEQEGLLAQVERSTDARPSIASPQGSTSAVTPAQIDLLRRTSVLGRFPDTQVVTAQLAATVGLPTEEVNQTLRAVRRRIARDIALTDPALAKKLRLPAVAAATIPQLAAVIASAPLSADPSNAVDLATSASIDDASSEIDIAANLEESKRLYQQLQQAEGREKQAKRQTKAVRVLLGGKLIEARKHFPLCGPNAKGWGLHCEAIGISTAQALRCMKAAGYGSSRSMSENFDDAADDVPAGLQRKWQTALGQIWSIPSISVLGASHRLACADSRVLGDVRRLMAGKSAACMVTDPPYGNDYVGGTDDALTIANNSLAELPDLLRAVFEVGNTALDDEAQIYVFYADSATLQFRAAFEAAGWHVHQNLLWLKDSPVVGRSMYQYVHEPILFGWRKKHHWYGGRDQSTVIKCARPKRSTEHPTSKPIELLSILIENSSRPGTLLYEPFSGSGSTLLAAEKTGRVCNAIEIDPGYVAVALERLAKIGLQPTLVDHGA